MFKMFVTITTQMACFRYVICLFRFAIASWLLKASAKTETVVNSMLSNYLSHGAVILLFIFLVALFLYWYGTCEFCVLKKMNVPGPVPRSFVGNIPDIKKYQGIHLMMLDYMRIYGKVFAISLGRKPSIVIADPEVLKQILVKDFSNFRNHHIPGKQPARFRRSIFAARDDYWKRIRNVLTPTFSAGKMKLMVPLIEKSCDVLLEKLEKIANTGKHIVLKLWRELLD